MFKIFFFKCYDYQLMIKSKICLNFMINSNILLIYNIDLEELNQKRQVHASQNKA